MRDTEEGARRSKATDTVYLQCDSMSCWAFSSLPSNLHWLGVMSCAACCRWPCFGRRVGL